MATIIFFYYDINKYSFNEICQSLYNAINKYSLPNVDTLFKNISEFLSINVKWIKLCLNTETCVKYEIENLSNSTIKIVLNKDLQRILVFFDFSNNDSTFPVAEIYISEKNIILENKGISDTLELVTKYVNENEFKDELFKVLSELSEKKYD